MLTFQQGGFKGVLLNLLLGLLRDLGGTKMLDIMSSHQGLNTSHPTRFLLLQKVNQTTINRLLDTLDKKADFTLTYMAFYVTLGTTSTDKQQKGKLHHPIDRLHKFIKRRKMLNRQEILSKKGAVRESLDLLENVFLVIFNSRLGLA